MLVSAHTGIVIDPGNVLLFRGHPVLSVVERFEPVRAREALRSLIAAVGQRRLWLMLRGLQRDKSGVRSNHCVLRLIPYRRSEDRRRNAPIDGANSASGWMIAGSVSARHTGVTEAATGDKSTPTLQ